ncbi:MAG: rhomboid family intramembrane serine protease [Marinifilaceae bacterium]
MKYKINLLFKPFVLIQFAIIFISVFTHWLLIMKLGMFPGVSTLFSIVLSLVLSLVVSFVYFKERFKILNFKILSSVNFHMLVLTILISVPAIFAQFYLVEMKEDLRELKTISELGVNETAKYYSIKDYVLEKEDIGFSSYNTSIRKKDPSFNICFNYALPILNRGEKLNKNNSYAYLRLEYHKKIKRFLNKAEQLKASAEFKEECSNDIKTKDFSKIIYFEKVNSDKDLRALNHAVNSNEKLRPSRIFSRDNVFFTAKEESLAIKSIAMLFCLIASLLISYVLFFLLLKSAKVNNMKRIKFDETCFSPFENFKFFFSFFIPRDGYRMTPILLIVNILIFALQLLCEFVFPLTYISSSFLTHTANIPFDGVPALLKLPIGLFMHYSLSCFLINIAALAMLGNFLEPLIGKKKMLSLYMQFGLFVAVGTFLLDMPFFTIGASNIIIGFYCIAFYISRNNISKPAHRKIYKLIALIFIAYNSIGLLEAYVDILVVVGVIIYASIFFEIVKPQIVSKKIK